MSILNEYFVGDCLISLENVTYNKLGEINEEVKLTVKDYFEIIDKEYASDNVEFKISRNLSFEPKSLVDINVCFSVVLKVDDKYKDSSELDYELIRNEMLSEDSAFMPIIMSRISLIISQLTSSYGERPIITPPSFMITE